MLYLNKFFNLNDLEFMKHIYSFIYCIFLKALSKLLQHRGKNNQISQFRLKFMQFYVIHFCNFLYKNAIADT
jgi:hypothetical protein